MFLQLFHSPMLHIKGSSFVHSRKCIGFSYTLRHPADLSSSPFQLESNLSLRTCIKKLWLEEGLTILYKGLSARIMQNAPTSGLMVLGYETLKRLSLKTS